MYSLQNIWYSFADRPVLSGIYLQLIPGEVTALIGKNGSGKTTLLEIAAGQRSADMGQIIRDAERIGYLPQQLPDAGTVQEFFEDDPSSAVHRALVKVGLVTINQETSLRHLSGGQKTKLGLARVLLDEPTILLLDEPTNNLDLNGLEWLSGFIAAFRGSVLLTSHDRAFLDAVSTRTAELAEGELKLYGGNYSFVRAQQQREREAYQAKYEAQETYKERLLEDISTTKSQALGVEQSTKQVDVRRYAKKVARKATVREARLEREMSGTDWLEKRQGTEGYYLQLPATSVPNGKIVVEAEALGKGFAGQPVISDLTFQLAGAERVRVSGANGSGKSTLLDLISGRLEADAGCVSLGSGIKFGRLSQDVVGLDLARSGKAELLVTGDPTTRCIQFGRALGFSIPELEQPVGSMSRGQQAKLALAKILLGSPQLLILDEPTNHIEMEAREAIERALKAFKGAILVASHDRYFIESLGINKEISLD